MFFFFFGGGGRISAFEFHFRRIIFRVFEFQIFFSNMISLFVDVALRAASILKNDAFCISWISPKLQNTFIWLDLSIGSMLERLVVKNAVECTSQRLKWTSGARVMIFPILGIFCVFRCLCFPTFPYFSILFHTFPYFSLPVCKNFLHFGSVICNLRTSDSAGDRASERAIE